MAGNPGWRPRHDEASDRGEAAADAARGEIARRYLGFITHWTP